MADDEHADRSAPSMLHRCSPAPPRSAMLPGASRLPFVGGWRRRDARRDADLDGVRPTATRLAAYDRVCGFDLGNVLPPTYPHMLAFPLHLALMTDGGFPFAAIGLVHISNRIVQHRPIEAGEPLDAPGLGSARWSPTRAGRSSRSAPRSGWARSWSGRRSRPTCTAAAATPEAPAAPRPAVERGAAGLARPGGCGATWAGATARCRATSTRSTSTR